MLPTFLLQKTYMASMNGESDSLQINPSGYHMGETPFESLRTAIAWAMVHDEDVIYCICGNDARVILDMDILESVVYDIAPEGIALLYVDVKYRQSIPVNQHCAVIEGIADVSSFLLLQPIYRFVLSLLDECTSNSEISWIALLRLIGPHAFALSNHIPEAENRIKFHIVSPFRNVANYIADYWASVSKQVYPDYHAYLIDDCSTDGSSELIDEVPNMTKVINTDRKYALENILNILLQQEIKDEDVICLLDADDRLPHKYVLNILHSVYQEKTLLLTYGSMRYLGGQRRFGKAYTREEFADLRNSKWQTSHLRTFRYKLFKELIKQDADLQYLKKADGQILRMPYDMALLFPLMELAGYENTRFIHTPLYEYRLHGNNDQYVNRKEQYDGEMEIRKKTRLKQAFL